jgi:dTDP-4-amino-4,6-dideoxygalactose transaminase
MLLGGGRLREFRSSLLGLTGGTEALLFSSGRFALLAALKAIGAPPGSDVVVQTYVCGAVPWAIEQANLSPVFCDLGSGWVATPQTVERQLTRKTAAILLAPPFGLFQDATPFRGLGLPIIHDLCQCNPLVLDGRWQEAGDFCALSFHPTKYLCAVGGGAIISNGSRSNGSGSATPGYQQRLAAFAQDWLEAAPINDIQAAIGCAQVSRVQSFRQRRRLLVESYLAALPEHLTQTLHTEIDVSVSDLFRLVLRSANIDFPRLRQAFAARGIAVRRGVDDLAHRTRGESDAQYPCALKALAQTLSLPLYPALSDMQLELVIRHATDLLGTSS